LLRRVTPCGQPAPRASGHAGERLAVDPRLALWVVNRDVGVVPGEARPRAEAPREFGYALLREPVFRGRAAFPQVDATGAGVAIEVVLSDQALLPRSR
jgi:hypothetical protein